MNPFARLRLEIWFAALAILAFVAGAAWASADWGKRPRLRFQMAAAPVKNFHPPKSAAMPLAATKVKWTSPKASLSRAGWTYDLCEPPAFAIDAATGGVHLLADETVEPEPMPSEEPGWELVAVESEILPVQLTGYRVSDGKMVGLFSVAGNRAVFRAGPGDRLLNATFAVESLGEEAAPGSMARKPLPANPVTARIRETGTGRVYVLPCGRTALSGGWIATLRSVEDGHIRTHVRAGDVLDLGADGEVEIVAVEGHPAALEWRPVGGGAQERIELRRESAADLLVEASEGGTDPADWAANAQADQ